MNAFQREKNVSIKDLAELAQVHYNTAKKALWFFHQLDSVIPKFEIEETGFRIVSKPDALEAVEGIFESLEMRILTKMMLVRATDPDKARRLDDVLTEEERNILPKLIERGFVNSIEGQFFLSARGRSLGSMGLSRIVKLNIPLPWESQARLQVRREEFMDSNVWVSFGEPKPIRSHIFATWKGGLRVSRSSEIRILHRRRERGFICAGFQRT